LVTRRKRVSTEIEAQVFERQARICKAFVNATRCRYLISLASAKATSDLQAQIGISEANLSQHIAILKAAGIGGTRREGRQVYLSLLMPEVKGACRLIRNVLRAQIRKGQRLII
jgi:DNA-binding transcriptional ArsR family regulator